MKLDFVKNTKRNIATALGNSFLGLLLPFLNRTLFLWLMAPQYLGLNGLFGSILGVLSLAELGFGTAIGYSMYKPVAEDDHELLCAYLNFYRKVYRCVGSVIFLGGLCLLPFLPRLVHGDLPPELDLRILYLLHLTNTAVSYFLFAYRGSILGAYHRYDILTKIRIIVSLAQYLTVFAILFFTRNYYHYVMATVGFTMASNLLILYQARKLYPNLTPRGTLPKEKRQKVVSSVKDLFLHKVGGTITYSFDNIVISAFLGLTAVAAYGNYFYVFTAVCGLTSAIYGSMQAGIGNRLNLETREQNFQLFLKTYRLTAIVVLWCAAMMLALFQPFLQVWTRGKPELARHFPTAILMVLLFYIQQSRQVVLTFKDAAGLWHQDRWKPLVAGIANLTLNILFVIFLTDNYKLDGVILSTILAFLFIQLPWESYTLFHNLFTPKESRLYWQTQARFALLACAICPLTWAATLVIPLQDLPGLAAKAVVAGIVASLLILALFKNDAKELAKKLRGNSKP
ncbi:MAG: oligosaccharide flippase family protein [Victivallales bacterium]|nr:oligosaccharide flippase family protein [Victivallales bacterium]